MRHLALHILTVFFILGFSLIGKAQNPDLLTQARSLFKPGDQVQWVKQFEGTINNKHKVILALGKNDLLYQGLIYYVNSKQTFFLNGGAKTNDITLNETDQNGNISGSIQAKINQQTFQGDWLNIDKSHGFHLALKETSSPVFKASYCGEEDRFKHFEGVLQKYKIQLYLHFTDKNRIKGYVYFDKKKKTLTANGYTDTDGSLFLNLEDENQQAKGAIKVRSNLSCLYKETKDFAVPFQIKLAKEIGTGCMAYISYCNMYEMSYPKLDGEMEFNQFIADQQTEWMNEIQSHSNRFVFLTKEYQPKNRNALRVYSWYQIHHLSNDLISGKWYFTNTWDDDFKAVDFNYDLKNKQNILIDDLFKIDSDHQSFVANYIQKELVKRPFKTDENYLTWIKDLAFDYFTIMDEGIQFSSDFHAIYGTQKVMIPFQNLKPYLKSESPLNPYLN